LESTKRFDDAEEVCEAAIEEVPAEAGLLSARRAALAWGRGREAEGLRLIAEHLDTYQSDGEAWAQAGDWHLAAGAAGADAASRAAFCYEEALLHAPTSAAAHARAGDAFFTAADATGSSFSSSSSSKASSLEAARKHYGAAIALSGGGGCARALWGLVACEAASPSSSSSSSKGGGKDKQQANGGEGAENAAPLAAAALLKKYREEAPDKVKLVEAALEGLGVKAAK
jgi:hypothetical protein